MLTKKFVVYLLLHRTELIKVQQIRPGGGGGLLGSIFAGFVPLASQNPYPVKLTL